MKARMTIAAIALGVCLVGHGCGDSAAKRQAQEQKAAEEKAAEMKARREADLQKLGGVWQRPALKINDGKTDVVPTLEIRLADELFGRALMVSGDQVAGEPMPAISRCGDFRLEGDGEKSFVVWAGASPDLKVEYELDGEKLKLKCEKPVDVVGLPDDFDLSGEWTRKKD